MQYFLTKDEWSASEGDWEKTNLEEEVSQLGQEVTELDETVNGDKNYVEGYYLDASGTPVSNSGYCYSDYIAIDLENIQGNVEWYYGTYNAGARLIVYNGNKEKIDDFSMLSNSEVRGFSKTQLGASCAYIRISFASDYIGKVRDAYTADYIYEAATFPGVLFGSDIVDNLVDGGHDKVLSAEQGKILKSSTDSNSLLIEQNTADIETVKIDIGKIIKNVQNYKSGYYLNADDEEVADANYCYSDYIPLDGSSLSGNTEWYYGSYNANARLIVYNGNKEKIDDFSMLSNSEVRGFSKTQLGASCAYIRISFSSDYVGKVRDAFLGQYIYTAKSYTDYTIDGLKQAVSLVGRNMAITTAASLTDGNAIEITDFPQALQKNGQISFNAKLSSFGNGFTLGRGTTEYGADKIKIDDTNIEISNLKGGTWVVYARAPHGLTFSTFVKVVVSQRKENLFVVIVTLNGMYQHEFIDVKYNHNGNTRVQSDGASLTDVVLAAANPDLKCPMWMFGDSYFGADTDNREMYYLLREWEFSNFLLCGFPGADSSEIFPDVERCLKYGTPKFIVWCLGMNDGTTDTMYSAYLEKMEAICEEKGIELILQTIPDVPNLSKTAINTVILASGHRYIDAKNAVGANNDGKWYNHGLPNDYLSSDNVHPSEYGARALAAQFLIDVPEIMEY